jgi:hypothetical protein
MSSAVQFPRKDTMPVYCQLNALILSKSCIADRMVVNLCFFSLVFPGYHIKIPVSQTEMLWMCTNIVVS